MKILYHFLYKNTLSAGRTIAYGYKNAFEDLGHEFQFLSVEDVQEEKFLNYKPDIFFTSLSPFPLKYLDLDILKKAKKNGLKVFVNIPFWVSPLSKKRVNEAPSLRDNPKYINLIKSLNYGDIYYNMCEQNDLRMKGFKKTIGKGYETVLLAADKTIIFPEYFLNFKSDISYIGTNLPGKSSFFENIIYPLKKCYVVKIYGQDWTLTNKLLGYLEKFSQYFNIPFLKNLRKPQLKLSDERKIYNSSLVSVNIHEDYQKKYGDLNERTFKIPLAGGFQIIDDVVSLKNYFKIGKEIVVAKDNKDWLKKIQFYIKNPKKRMKIIELGRIKVLNNHTYHHRVEQFIKLYEKII